MANLRILVADDNPLSLRFIADALATLDIDAVEVADGVAATEHAALVAFDLLLLDARMPRLGGAGALARIRAQAGPSQQAIALATTADDDVAAHAQLVEVGFAAVLVKPFTVDALRAALAAHAIVARTMRGRRGPRFDDARALQVAGGDAGVLAALRILLMRELEQLPQQVEAMARDGDVQALRERLHRLDASAGFCGMPDLAHASGELRSAIGAADWPHAAVAIFLDVCNEHARALAST